MATCAIVTAAASGPVSDIHHRMPVSVTQDNWPLWLGEDGKGAAALMTGAPDAFRFHRVDAAVNSNRAQGQDLIDPLTV